MGWNLLVAAACLVGIVGTIVPVVPGALLCAIAVVVWCAFTGGWAWALAAAVVALFVATTVVKYLIPGRRMQSAGIPGVTLLIGGVAGIVGFFVLPVIGLPVGFVAGIYLAELIRLRSARSAWPSTVEAMKAAGLSALIELLCAMLITGLWVVAAL